MSSSYVHSLIHRWSANEGQSKGSRERMCVATVNCQKHCGLSLRLRGHFLSETCICAVGHVNRTVTKDQSSAPLPTNFQALSAITICRTMQLDLTLLKPCLLLVYTIRATATVSVHYFIFKKCLGNPWLCSWVFELASRQEGRQAAAKWLTWRCVRGRWEAKRSQAITEWHKYQQDQVQPDMALWEGFPGEYAWRLPNWLWLLASLLANSARWRIVSVLLPCKHKMYFQVGVTLRSNAC